MNTTITTTADTSNRVIIFDTTLRDGEQSPGFSMTPRQKLKMARMLGELGVDVIEAGFAAASPGDFASVQDIAKEAQTATICSLARCLEGDIVKAADALEAARSKRLHVFVATSPIHREHKLKMSREQVIKQAVMGVELARSRVDDVEFSAEDAIRTEPEFLAEVLSATIAAGATTVNIPDTVGYTTPTEMAELIHYLRAHVEGIEKAVISTHCHNDLGMAAANSLAAVKAGARQIECTINGIGERAGNAALEEVVMALHTRADVFSCNTGIDTRKLQPASRLLAGITGNFVPRNKAIVGDNAFAHESGIHQHGMLANAETYEIMKPEDVGISRSQLVLGKHSGRHAVVERARALGFELSGNQLDQVFAGFKRLADQKKRIFDADIEALIAGTKSRIGGPWRFRSLKVDSGIGDAALPTAAVSLEHENGQTAQEAAIGDGPLDAAFKALVRATGITLDLRGIAVRSISEGEDAQGEAEVRASFDGKELSGHGISTDIVVACAEALLQIINRIARRQESLAPIATSLTDKAATSAA